MKEKFAFLMFAVFASIYGLAACSTSGGGNGSAQCHAPADPQPGDGGLRPFTPPDKSKLTAGQLLLTASGEALAQQGVHSAFGVPLAPRDQVSEAELSIERVRQRTIHGLVASTITPHTQNHSLERQPD